MDDARVEDLRRLLTGARLWGLELDTGYRVLAATVEVATARHPDGPDVADGRLQVLFHPVARVAGLLTHRGDDGRVRIERFPAEQLALVVDRFDGPVLDEDVVDREFDDPSSWAPELSFEGASRASDGRGHTVAFDVDGPDGRHLRVAAWFDEIELRRPDGSTIA